MNITGDVTVKNAGILAGNVKATSGTGVNISGSITASEYGVYVKNNITDA